MKGFFRELLVTFILAIVVFFILQATVQSFIVVGKSMEPGLHEGQRLIISKVVYAFHEPERGDVIVFHPPDNPETEYIKRIIALPGEAVEVKEGKVYVYKNGKAVPLDESSYINDPPKYTMSKDRVPHDSYFVLGDNRNNSNDSHNDWTVPHKNIIGKAWLSVWPPGEWGIFPNYALDEQIMSLAHKLPTMLVKETIWR